MNDLPGDVTNLLQEWSRGDRDAFDKLVPLVYQELRAIAAGQLQDERAGHSLQPTALVHEAFIRLVEQDSYAWKNRKHFVAVAARAMRRILVDHARHANAQRRPPPLARLSLDLLGDIPISASETVLFVHDALSRLEATDTRQARLIELRFFVGLSIEETAEALGISVPTAVRDWRFARAWLRKQLSSPITSRLGRQTSEQTSQV